MERSKRTAKQELCLLISGIGGLRAVAAYSAEHVRWHQRVVVFLEEVFGRDSRFFSSFTSLTWRRGGHFLVGGVGDPEGNFNPQAAIDREHHKAYLEQLETARGLLLAAHDELEMKGLSEVYHGEAAAPLASLHPTIYAKCHELYEKKAYAEAVEKSFKVVRDRLRKLTGFETGSEAFGKGKLHAEGAAAPNVDQDFNDAVKFLTMSIDRFRNEKSHTSDAKIDDPIRAYEYLSLSSLAMNLLENTKTLT